MVKIIKNLNKSEYETATAAVNANGGYCPCALEHTEDYKCMCKEFRENPLLTECFCGRYMKVEVKENNNGIN